MKVTEGEASFNSELQNEPIDPDNATFNEEWFDWYEPELMDWKSSEFVFIGSNDPSLGKNKKSDTSAIINLALSTKLDTCMWWMLRSRRENLTSSLRMCSRSTAD